MLKEAAAACPERVRGIERRVALVRPGHWSLAPADATR